METGSPSWPRWRSAAQRGAIEGATLALVADPPTTRSPIPEEIAGPRVVAIGRGLPAERIERIAEGLVAGGIRAFEITLNSPDAFSAIAALAERWGARLLVGAGTVLDVEGAARAAEAGARFIVSPHTDPALIDWAVGRGLPVFPGAFSPTEILSAWRSGATAVKLFPASVAGPAFVREFRGPFRDIPLIATGGVTIETAPGFLSAGAVAVGMGSWLTGDGEPEAIAERATRLIRALAGGDA
jgi:2-dehydro-3-deoxyphosphogluconate aldolase / (4S)-4-hydroxy-2-oxoglutarate aldolase